MGITPAGSGQNNSDPYSNNDNTLRAGKGDARDVKAAASAGTETPIDQANGMLTDAFNSYTSDLTYTTEFFKGTPGDQTTKPPTLATPGMLDLSNQMTALRSQTPPPADLATQIIALSKKLSTLAADATTTISGSMASELKAMAVHAENVSAFGGTPVQPDQATIDTAELAEAFLKQQDFTGELTSINTKLAAGGLSPDKTTELNALKAVCEAGQQLEASVDSFSSYLPQTP